MLVVSRINGVKSGYEEMAWTEDVKRTREETVWTDCGKRPDSAKRRNLAKETG